MDQEKLVHQMNESRLISAADNVLYPLIKQKILHRIDLACARFTGGEKDFIADVAYIKALKEIESELKRLQTQGNKATAELNNLK